MTPGARVQAAIEVLDGVIAAARDGGPAADTLIASYFRTRRYAGSKDRRAVRALVYDAIRRSGERPETGRAAVVGLIDSRPELAGLFDGTAHGPAPIADSEGRAAACVVPGWIVPLLAEPVEQDALLERAPLDVRVNRLKVAPDEIADTLEVLLRKQESRAAEGSACDPGLLPSQEHKIGRISFLPDALRLPEGFALEQTEAWANGQVEVQDAGSQLIAAACAAAPGMTVIDLCAGAGGKTLTLAAAMANHGRLVAVDVNRERLRRLEPRALRAGVTCAETLLIDQGHEAGGLEALADAADVVLVDAPCSGTGTWRRNPEGRWRLTEARLERLVAEQARILDLAAPLVRPGGALVYAVCALTDREGRDQIDAFLARNPGWYCESLALGAGRSWGAGLLLTPVHDGTDGFFVARLRKS